MADIPVPSLPDVTPAPTDRQMVVQADDELGLTPAVSAADVDGKVSKSGDTMTGNLTVADSYPALVLDSTVAPTDQSRFAILADGQLVFRSQTDAGATVSSFFRADHDGSVLFAGPSVSVPDLKANGNIEAASTAPKLTLNETDEPGNARAWKMQASAGTLKISSATDAGAQQTAFITIDRATGEVDMTGASSVSVPDLTATGDVTVSKASPFVDIDADTGTGGYLRWKRNGTPVFRWESPAGNAGQLVLQRYNPSGGAYLSTPIQFQDDGSVNLTGASSVSVPAAADGDTNTAAQTTGFDSTTGQVQVNGVEVGDTGPRADSTALLNGWTGSDTIIQRVGNMVTVALVSLNGTSNTDAAVYPLPAGFRPSNTNFARVALADSAGGVYRGYVAANSLYVTTISAGSGGNPTTDITGLYASWTFPTDDAWPATLPGTPA